MIRTILGVLAAASLCATVALVHAQQPDRAAVQLAAAHQKATLEGDLPGAIRQYQTIVDTYAKTDRPIAAQALLDMADAYRTLGDSRADVLYAKVVHDYADQKASAAAASARLTSRPMPKLICDDCGDEEGSVSADGRLMATTTGLGGTHDIGILDLTTGALQPLHIEDSGVNNTGWAEGALLSPDARQVAYEWFGDNARELRVVARDNAAKAKVLLTDPQFGHIYEPLAWTTNGSLLVGVSDGNGNGKMALALVSQAGALREIKALNWQMPGGTFHQVSLSPDERSIAYAALAEDQSGAVRPQNAKSLAWQIHICAIDGSHDVVVTSGAGAKKNPVWAPDGRHVVYLSNVNGSWGLFATSVENGRPGDAVSVRTEMGSAMSLGVTRSGWYYFYALQPGLYWASIAEVVPGGQHPAQVINRIVGAGPTFSPDGKFVALSRRRLSSTEADSTDVVVHAVNGGDEHVFRQTGLEVATFPYQWFGNAGLLTSAMSANQPDAWYRIDVAARNAQKLTAVAASAPSRPHPNVKALSPDGKTIYFGSWKLPSDGPLDRVIALDLATGVYRDVFRLPVSDAALPRHAQDFAIAMNPDGRSLALLYFDYLIEATHVAVVNVDGSGYRELCSPVQATDLRNKVAWTHDGRWVYFATTVGKPDAKLFHVMRVLPSGGTPEYVGIELKNLENFDVSPDGSRVVFSTVYVEGAAQPVWALDISDVLRSLR